MTASRRWWTSLRAGSTRRCARLLLAFRLLYSSIERALESFDEWLSLEPPLDIVSRRRSHDLSTDLRSLGVDVDERSGDDSAIPGLKVFGHALARLRRGGVTSRWPRARRPHRAGRWTDRGGCIPLPLERRRRRPEIVARAAGLTRGYAADSPSALRSSRVRPRPSPASSSSSRGGPREHALAASQGGGASSRAMRQRAVPRAWARAAPRRVAGVRPERRAHHDWSENLGDVVVAHGSSFYVVQDVLGRSDGPGHVVRARRDADRRAPDVALARLGASVDVEVHHSDRPMVIEVEALR